ncbi:hypothetical protein OROHE_025537 [Orobanche hederae]
MVMEILCPEREKKCWRTMFSLMEAKKIQSWGNCKLQQKVIAVAETDPGEVMRKARDSCRLVRVDWIVNPRLKKLKDPSEKWWVDPVEDLREKWRTNPKSTKWVDPSADPRSNWARRMVLEMLSCDPDDWVKALRLKRRFDDKIYDSCLDRDLKKLCLIGDMDPTEVACCLRDYCRLVTVEWIPGPRKTRSFFLNPDGPEKILVPGFSNADEIEEAEKRKIQEIMSLDDHIRG